MKERSTMMSQQMQQQRMMNMNQNMLMNQMSSQSQPQIVPMNRNYGLWAPPPQFQNPNPIPGAMKPPLPAYKKSLGPRSDWKGKKVNKLNDKRRSELQKSLMAGSSSNGISGGVNMVRGSGGVGNSNFNSYQTPTVNELQHQNPLKSRKFFPKKKYNKSNNMNMEINNDYYGNNMSAPFAPRNTTSFIIRAKKSGGIASLVSPSPMTPAVLPTPILSPSREVLVDMAKEEWGVDGYGSMKGLIRLRLPGHEMEIHDDEMEDEGGSSESDMEEHVEVERRLDHDLSRFEMIYHPNEVSGMEYHNVLENRVDDQDSHISQLEEENLILKERLFLMERDLDELRRRVQFLENKEHKGEENNEEVVDNDIENESEHHADETQSVEGNNGDLSEDNITQDDGSCKQKQVDSGHISEQCEAAATTSRSFGFGFEKKIEKYDDGIGENGIDKMVKIAEIEDKDESKSDKLIVVNHGDESTIVKDRKEKSTNEDKSVDALVDVCINVDVEASAHVVGEGDTRSEEIGVGKPSRVLPSDVGN